MNGKSVHHARLNDWLIVGELKSVWQVVSQCLSKYPWINLIVGAPIKGGLIQYRERKIQSHDFLLQKSTKMAPISEAKIAKKSSVPFLINIMLFYL